LHLIVLILPKIKIISKKSKGKKQMKKITIIGNAIIDVFQKVDDNFLNQHKMEKGSMILIDKERLAELRSFYSENINMESGGSGANTAIGIANLGGNVNFIGNVTNDKEGNFFIESIKNKNVNYTVNPINNTKEATSECFVYVTPDGERTMNTYLGISTNLSKENLDEEALKNCDVLYIEGYLWDHQSSKETVLHACKLAENAKISLTLSDSFCVERHRDSFKELIKNEIDLLFCNEKEILSLFETSNLNEAIQEVKKYCELAIITCGAKGSMIISTNETIEIPAEKIEKLVDTTGAGDNYAAGFLYGYAKDLSFEECGKIGGELSAKVIQKYGATA
jgi:fructokinase